MGPQHPWAPITSTSLGSNQPTTTWPKSVQHPIHQLMHHHRPQLPHHTPHLSPTTPPPTTLGPNHPPSVGINQPTSSWPKSPHYHYVQTHQSLTTPGSNQPTTLHPITPPILCTNPSPLGLNHPSANTSSSSSLSSSLSSSSSASFSISSISSASTSTSTRELEIIEKFFSFPPLLNVQNSKSFSHLLVVECPYHLTCHHH